MFPNDFDFLLPPVALQETPLPEAFDRAQRVSKEWQDKTRRKRRRVAPREVSVLWEEFLSELKIERGLSANALNAYEKDLQIYLSWLQMQDIQLRHVTAAQVESYRRALQSGQIHKISPARKRSARKRPAPHAKFYAPPTLARKLVIVRDWHRFLSRKYGWPDPTAHLEVLVPSVNSSPPRTRLVLSIEQTQALLQAPNRLQTLGKRDRAILSLLCEGFSALEIGALRSDIEGKDGLMLGEKVGESARAALREYSEVARPLLVAKLKRKRRYSFRLFFSTRGTPLSPVTINQIVRRYAQATLLPAWVSPVNLTKSNALRRAGHENGAALPRATQLRHAYEKAHPRA